MLGKTALIIALFAAFTIGPLSPFSMQPNDSNGNPHPQKDNFSHWPDFGADQTWRYLIFDGNNGSIAVNGPTTFDNSTAELTEDKQLRFVQVYDSDFESEDLSQYNNVFMIGLQGYIPNADRDIIWNFEMQIDPDTYGTTGFVIERKDTFAADGTLALPFDFFGVTYAGADNYNAGLRCTNLVNWFPVSQDLIPGVDPFQWNEYEIRFHFIDAANVLASIAVNGVDVCQMTIDNYGETEIQIWLDNYHVVPDPSNPQGFSVGFSNSLTPQSVLYDNIAAKAKPTP